MHRSHSNVSPVANKYLAHKQFLKDQEEHKMHLKNIHGLIDQSPPTARPHCTDRTRQKQIRERELEMIQNENDRLRTRMIRNGAFTDSHNDYVSQSLNTKKRNRDEAQHRNVMERLQKQITQVRTNYPTRKYERDYTKQQDFKQQITRYPSINK